MTLPAIDRATTTAREGTFQFDSVLAGVHTLIVRGERIAAVDTSLLVRAGGVLRLTLRVTVLGLNRLTEIVVTERVLAGSVRTAPDVDRAMILAGAKSEVVEIANLDANLAEKVPRQIFAKVPGLFVYDMDGSGNQVNISTRGLDPHRSWELNVRQDGTLLNSDLYAYPASHYSPPLEAIQRVVLVRGTAALQYGSQFGGLVDYVTKTPDTTRAVSLESINAVGSFKLASSFNALGGRLGALTYYAYASVRREDGYRDVSRSTSSAQYVMTSMAVTPAFDLRAQVGRSTYLYRIPGPLTDAMFQSDARTATRSRNWFNPDIVVPAVSGDWRPDSATRVIARLSGVFGVRNSVQFVGFATTPDVPNAQGQPGPRQVDIDDFNSRTAEVRATRDYAMGALPSTLAAGLAVSFNDTRRRQQGRGTTGSDFDLALSTGGFGRDLHYRTKAVAIYAENMVRLSPRFSVIPGARLERGRTRMDGYLAYYDPANTPRDIAHDFPLFGVRGEYKADGGAEWYGGWSQAYRPMILKDVLPENALEQTDPNIRDAKGWTSDVGVRGIAGAAITYDISAFLMRYDHRFGTVLRTDASGASFLFKTNVGSTLTKGLEVRVDVPIVTTAAMSVRGFSATSWFGARYRAGSVSSGGKNVEITGNRVEAVPEWISRSGVSAGSERWSLTTLISYTGTTFADPLNTVTPSTTGAIGEVPAYTILDVNGSLVLGRVRLQGGASNATDAQYFTKRPTFYPGPGVWPSDGRSVQLSASIML